MAGDSAATGRLGADPPMQGNSGDSAKAALLDSVSLASSFVRLLVCLLQLDVLR
jgi:hypothetical protein